MATAKSEDAMTKAKRNAKRGHRIAMEIIVDAYGPEEQAMYAFSSEGKTCVEGGYGILGCRPTRRGVVSGNHIRHSSGRRSRPQ
jgi:hypothetical protein